MVPAGTERRRGSRRASERPSARRRLAFPRPLDQLRFLLRARGRSSASAAAGRAPHLDELHELLQERDNLAAARLIPATRRAGALLGPRRRTREPPCPRPPPAHPRAPELPRPPGTARARTLFGGYRLGDARAFPRGEHAVVAELGVGGPVALHDATARGSTPEARAQRGGCVDLLDDPDADDDPDEVKPPLGRQRRARRGTRRNCPGRLGGARAEAPTSKQFREDHVVLAAANFLAETHCRYLRLWDFRTRT